MAVFVAFVKCVYSTRHVTIDSDVTYLRYDVTNLHYDVINLHYVTNLY